MGLKVLAQADFDRLPKGLRGIPIWRAEKTGELWPEPEEPDDPDEWRDECDDPSREDEDEGD